MLKRLKYVALTVLSTLLICLSLTSCNEQPTEPEAGDGVADTAAESSTVLLGTNVTVKEGKEVVIVNGKVTDYLYVISGTAPHGNAGQTANQISEWFWSKFKSDIPYESNINPIPTKNVIVYGRVDEVASSKKLADAIDEYPADSHVWGVAYENGALAFYANSKTALDDEKDLFTDFFKGIEEFIVDGKFVVSESFLYIREVTASEYAKLVADYEEELAKKEEEERLATIERLKVAIATEFTDAQFDPDSLGLTADMEKAAGKSYGSPLLYPTAGEHPRLLFTKDDIPGILAALESTENQTAINTFVKQYKTEYSGILPEPTRRTDRVGFHNLDYQGLQIIQAKALAYVLYGDERYGYEAIYAIMNYIRTLYVDSINSDMCRDFGYIMYISGCVYDWCYDLLTEDDMRRITLGIEHLICRGTVPNEHDLIASSSYNVKMEIGFPPSKQGSVSGHGSEMQLLRDYLSFSIAIFDETPGWYEFVGGRFYQDYVTPRNTYYEAGLYPQGTSYNAHRFLCDLFSAAIMNAAVGEIPYSDDLIDAVYGLYATVNDPSENYVFRVGDIASTTTKLGDGAGNIALIASHLYGDSTLRSIASRFAYGYTKFKNGNSTVHAAEFLIFSSTGISKDLNYLENLPLVTYYGGYVGQFIARGSWVDDTPVVLMKIQERTTANHDHSAAGTFQIYYKGILTGDLGDYGGTAYGSDHCRYFLRATVSHNGLLVYNPAYAETQNGYYTGGQRVALSEAGSFAAWQSTVYDTGDVTGHSYGYTNTQDTKFVYISGDITDAYEATTVEYIGRSMLSVYTGDEKMPMIMFVFDRIDAVNPEFKSTFLLQVPGTYEPVIDDANKAVTVTNGEGKLVLYNVIGGDDIAKYGGVDENGEKLNYYVNGKQLSFVVSGAVKDSNSWGRVELSQTTPDSKTDNFLNVIAVADNDKEITLGAKRVVGLNDDGNALLEGASFGSVTAMFANKASRVSEEMSFVTEGDGLIEYYISGLYTGTWTVSVGGDAVGTVYATADSGMVYFKAPVGEITLTPGADIRPANSGELSFVTNGGIFDSKPIQFYPLGAETELPTNITNGKNVFEGWYADAEFTKPITHIPADAPENFTVYAKWTIIYANENYAETEIKKTSSLGLNGFGYSDGGKGDSFFYTENDYLVWTTKSSWPAITFNSSSYNISNSPTDTFTYVVSMAKNGDEKINSTRFGIRDSSKNEAHLFFVKSDGRVVDSTQSYTLLTLGQSFTTLKIVVDFAAEMIYYYDELDSPIHSTALKIPSAADVPGGAAWKTKFGAEMFKWYAMGDSEESSIRIGGIAIMQGDRVSGSSDTPATPVNKIVYYTNGGSFKNPPDTSYVTGEEKLLATDVLKDGAQFLGWYTDETYTEKITSVPADASGKFNVYAKWVSIVDYKNNCTLTETKVVNMHECTNHTAENADENGVCKSCGYCTEVNAAICPYYTKPTNIYKDTTCEKCGKLLAKVGSLGVFSSSDNAISYAGGLTLEGGKTPIAMVVSSPGTQFNYPGNLYESIFDKASGNINCNAFVIEIDLGIPTEAQYTSLLAGKNYTDKPNGAKPIGMGLRIGSSNAQYSPFVVYTVGGKLSFTDKVEDAFATLPVGDLSTYKIVLDFSTATPGDGAQDFFKVYVFDEDGELLASSTAKTKDGFDISAYTYNLAQWRVTSGGAIMYDNMKAYTANLDAGELPSSPEKPEATVGKTIFSDSFDKEEYSPGFLVGKNNEATCTFEKNDGKLVWSAMGQWTYISKSGNALKESESNVFTFTTELAKLPNSELLYTKFIFQNEAKVSNTVFYTNDSGVYAADGKLLMELTETLKTLTFVVSFEECTIRFYDENGNSIHEVAFSWPNLEGLSAAEVKNMLRKDVEFKWQSEKKYDEVHSIAIGSLEIVEGNAASAK